MPSVSRAPCRPVRRASRTLGSSDIRGSAMLLLVRATVTPPRDALQEVRRKWTSMDANQICVHSREFAADFCSLVLLQLDPHHMLFGGPDILGFVGHRLAPAHLPELVVAAIDFAVRITLGFVGVIARRNGQAAAVMVPSPPPDRAPAPSRPAPARFVTPRG